MSNDADAQLTVIRIFGAFTVESPTRDPANLPGGRAQLLLQRLVAAAPDAVDGHTLAGTLWPEGPPASAARTIASLVSRLRTLLPNGGLHGSPSAGYSLTLGRGVTTDLARAEELAGEGANRIADSPALAASAAERGLDIVNTGALFGGQAIDHDWFDDLDRRIRALRNRLQRLLWDSESRLGQWQRIMDHAEAVFAVDPCNEEAARALMTAHWNTGDRGSALQVHQVLRDRLRSDLEVEPSSDTDDLFHLIATTTPTPTRLGSPRAVPSGPLFVGRDSELASLVDLWGKAAKKQPQAVMITGPLGSGRSRLVDEFSELVHRAGGAVFRAECYEAHHSAFLQPILDVLGSSVLSLPAIDIRQVAGPWIDTLADLIPDVATVCGIAPYRRASPDLEHRRVMQMIVEVVTGLAHRHPLLLVFDDLHHSGVSTMEALQWVVRELPSVPVMIAMTTGPDHADPGLAALRADSSTIPLTPISARSVRELVAAHGRRSDYDFIWELTHGHALFVVEVIASLERGIDQRELATSLAEIVLDRIQGIGGDLETVLRAASFVGLTFDVETVEQVVSDRRPVLPALLRATQDGLIEPTGSSFTFANRVIRDVLHETALGPLRHTYHQRLAKLANEPETRAFHLEAAGDYLDAARAWMLAADGLRRRFAGHDAIILLTRAVDAARDGSDPAVQAAALLQRGAAHEEVGNYVLARDDHLGVEAVARELGDSQMLTRAIERLGWTAYYARDVERAHDRAMQAVSLPGAHPSAWVLAGRLHHWGGDFDRAADAYNSALDHADNVDFVRASALSCLGALLEHSDRYAEAEKTLDEAISLAQHIGAFRPLLRALFFQGMSRANDGNFAGALTALETKGTLLTRYEVSFYSARTATCLAWVWRELGELERSRELSDEALAMSRLVDAGELQVEQELHALCSLAECELLDGNEDTAAERLDAAGELLAGWLPFHDRAELRVLEIRTRLGLTEPEELRVRAESSGSPKYRALAASHVGLEDEAIKFARHTGSTLLLARVSPDARARQARDELAVRLPQALREGFVARGQLSRRFVS